MRLPVILRPLANADVRHFHEELETQIPGLGEIFLDQLQEVLDRIESMPEMYPEILGPVRAARLRRFRHVVYYVAFADRVELLAVLHASAEGSAWQSRM